MNDITELDDINVADLMPPADPALLASANRMLSGRLNRIAGALRGTGITSFNSIEDGEDLTPHVDWLIVRYFDAIHGLGKQQALVDILKHNLQSKEHECEALRKSLEAAQSRGDDRPIEGYYVIDRTMPDADTLDEAMELAMLNVREGGDSQLVLEVRLIGTAKRAAEWVPA